MQGRMTAIHDMRTCTSKFERTGEPDKLMRRGHLDNVPRGSWSGRHWQTVDDLSFRATKFPIFALAWLLSLTDSSPNEKRR
jgi:hypothetical protein